MKTNNIRRLLDMFDAVGPWGIYTIEDNEGNIIVVSEEMGEAIDEIMEELSDEE